MAELGEHGVRCVEDGPFRAVIILGCWDWRWVAVMAGGVAASGR
jgi:hypothetical protein